MLQSRECTALCRDTAWGPCWLPVGHGLVPPAHQDQLCLHLPVGLFPALLCLASSCRKDSPSAWTGHEHLSPEPGIGGSTTAEPQNVTQREEAAPEPCQQCWWSDHLCPSGSLNQIHLLRWEYRHISDSLLFFSPFFVTERQLLSSAHSELPRQSCALQSGQCSAPEGR